MFEGKITTELSKTIEDLIIAYYSEPSAQPPYLKSLAKEHQLLPVLIDWTGFFGLKPDGRVFVVSTEDEFTVQEETDERLQRVAIFQGAKKYPGLKELIPCRPLNAIECRHCEGHGRIVFQNVDIICYCGGLGWLQEEEVIGEST